MSKKSSESGIGCGCIAFALGFWLVLYVVWVAVVFILRALVLATTVVAGVALASVLTGLVVGALTPILAFRQKNLGNVSVATPEEVQAGTVISGTPQGVNGAEQWDFAWPNYVPYQLRRDMAAVKHHRDDLRDRAMGRLRGGGRLRFILLFVPVAGFVVGMYASYLVWALAMWLVTSLAGTFQKTQYNRLKSRDAKAISALRGGLRCPHCHRSTPMPAYKCPNPDCDVLHFDVAPGPLGIKYRICGCSVTSHMPVTVEAASRELEPYCPFCERPQAAGSGARRIVVAPVFGSVGAGKTQFLVGAAAGMQEQMAAQGGTMAPMSDRARRFLAEATRLTQERVRPNKTAMERPVGLQYEVAREGSSMEVQFYDAAGESFHDTETTRELAYMDEANTVVFLLDPLALPDVRDRAAARAREAGTQVAQGDPGLAYGALVDRLRNDGRDLDDVRLAVVVSKTDAVNAALPHDPIPADSDGVRTWLRDHDADHLIRRFEHDFKTVCYFGVDSFTEPDPLSPRHPMAVLDWVVTAERGAPLLAPRHIAEPAAEDKENKS